MDPFTVSTACVGLLAAVAQLTGQISGFVSSVREARRDMDAVNRELFSLSMCLETLRDDSSKIQYPDGLHQNLLAVLRNCDLVTKQMAELLQKMSSGNIARRAQWTAYGRDNMNKSRSSLESHKSALDIALDLTALLITTAVKEDTEIIRADTAAIKDDTSQIPQIKQDTAVLVQEIASLRLQVTILKRNDSTDNVVLRRFLDDTTSYAETVLDNQLSDEESDVTNSRPTTPRIPTPTLSAQSLKGKDVAKPDDSSTQVLGRSQEFKNYEATDDSEASSRKIGIPTDSSTPTNSISLRDEALSQVDFIQRITPQTLETPNDTLQIPVSTVSATRQVEDGASVEIEAIDINANDAVSPVVKDAIPAPRSQPVIISQSKNPGSLQPASQPRTLNNGLVANARRRPDYTAMEAAKLARSTLSNAELEVLDLRFENLLMLEKPFGIRFFALFKLYVLYKTNVSNVKEMLDAGANMLAKGYGLYTRMPKLVELLLSRGALVNLDKDEVSTVFLDAVDRALMDPDWIRQSGVAIVELLLDFGVNPDVEYRHFNSPSALERSVRAGDTYMVGILIAYGAKVSINSTDGLTLLDVAWKSDDLKMVAILLRHEAKLSGAFSVLPEIPQGFLML